MKMFSSNKKLYRKGFESIYPNNKHETRTKVFGCSELSPMQLGPVDHGQPGLPPAKNIENFHQGSKCFKEELLCNNKPSKEFYDNQLAFFNDPIAHRHKLPKNPKEKTKKKNIPEFFVWKHKDGKEHHLTYIECRQFYCTFYERLATKTTAFKELKELLEKGTNLNIIGYDAKTLKDYKDPKVWHAQYLDDSTSFGHEMVLACLLSLNDPAQYPWNIEKQKNKTLFVY